MQYIDIKPYTNLGSYSYTYYNTLLSITNPSFIDD